MDYILTPDGELYHHGVKGMKWGVRKSDNKQPIGSNYRTDPGLAVEGDITDEEDEEIAEWLKMLGFAVDKGSRYYEAGVRWIRAILQTPVADTLSGKGTGISWQEAKEWVDGRHQSGDPDLFLTDKYR